MSQILPLDVKKLLGRSVSDPQVWGVRVNIGLVCGGGVKIVITCMSKYDFEPWTSTLANGI